MVSSQGGDFLWDSITADDGDCVLNATMVFGGYHKVEHQIFVTVKNGEDCPRKSYRQKNSTTVPDNNRLGISSTISVYDHGTIDYLDIYLSSKNTEVVDLDIELVSPQRTVVQFIDHQNSAHHDTETWKDKRLYGFEEEGIHGLWELHLTDRAESTEEEVIRSWHLTFGICP
jgi:subtilisin-like proprotein convertase family protein